MNRRNLFAAILGFPVAAIVGKAAAATPELPLDPIDWTPIEPPPLPAGWMELKPIEPFLGEIRTRFVHYEAGGPVLANMHSHTIHMHELPAHAHAYAIPVAITQYEQWNGTTWIRLDDGMPYEQPPLEVACGNRIAIED